MAALSVEELYEQYIKPLSPKERLELVAITTRDLAETSTEIASTPKRSIMELHGLGATMWQGTDAQKYVNELREEWDDRP